MDTLWIQPHWSCREASNVMSAAPSLGYKVMHGPNPGKKNRIPVGTIEYCEDFLGFSPTPDFYPEFLKQYMFRRVWLNDAAGGTVCSRFFAKARQKYKECESRVYEKNEQLPEVLLICTEVVRFVQEWRYYVADGCVLTTGWYDGHDDNEPAPELGNIFPTGWHGAADFGRLDTGEIALVECQHPYACGWYGEKEESNAYVMWLAKGWKYMLENFGKDG